MVKHYIIKKEIKEIGNSIGLIFNKEEKNVWKIKKGDIILIEIHDKEDAT